MSLSCFFRILEEIKDAYSQWTTHRDKIFESINNRTLEMCKGSSLVAQKLNGTIPEDVWITDENVKAEIFGQSGDLQKELFGSHYGDAWKNKKKMQMFGKDFSYDSTSELETLRNVVARVSQHDKGIVSGAKMVKVGESTLFKNYLERRIKQFITCLPYINHMLFPGFRKTIIWLSRAILHAIMYLKPLPEYMNFDAIQDGASKLLYIKSEFQNWGETGRYV